MTTRTMCYAYHQGTPYGGCSHYKAVGELPNPRAPKERVQLFSCVDCGNVVLDRGAHDKQHPPETEAERADRALKQYTADLAAGKGRIDSLVAAWKGIGATDAEIRASLSYIGPETHQ